MDAHQMSRRLPESSLRAGLVALPILVAASYCGPAIGAAQSCELVAPSREGSAYLYPMGHAWSGSGPRFGAAITAGGTVVAAYYGADRFVTLSTLSPSPSRLCTKQFASRFGGWDAHNDLAVAVSPDGALHVAGNAHASELFYARGSPDDLASVREMDMIGRDESFATYPTFMRGPLDELLFLYRNGKSGDGEWLVNRWEEGAWSRLGSVFAARDGEGALSAYPSKFVRGRDGTIHVAVVWRRRMDAAANFAVGYARTRDMVNWSGLRSKAFLGPATRERIDTVEITGERAGLVNDAKIVMDPKGNPAIAYARYGADGNDAIVVARVVEGQWQVKEIARSNRRSDVSGGGVMTGLPRVEMTDAGTNARLDILFPPANRRRLLLNLTTLESQPDTGPPQGYGPAIGPAVFPKGLANPARMNSTVFRSGFDGPTNGRLVWFAQASDRDRARKCSKDAPLACKPPPAPLMWVTSTPP